MEANSYNMFQYPQKRRINVFESKCSTSHKSTSEIRLLLRDYRLAVPIHPEGVQCVFRSGFVQASQVHPHQSQESKEKTILPKLFQWNWKQITSRHGVASRSDFTGITEIAKPINKRGESTYFWSYVCVLDTVDEKTPLQSTCSL